MASRTQRRPTTWTASWAASWTWTTARGARARHGDREPAPTEHIESAETKGELAQRVYRAVEEIVARPCGHQVVVTHGMAMTLSIAAWIKMPLAAAGYVSFRATSGGITVLEEDDHHWRNGRVISLNDTSHLLA